MEGVLLTQSQNKQSPSHFTKPWDMYSVNSTLIKKIWFFEKHCLFESCRTMIVVWIIEVTLGQALIQSLICNFKLAGEDWRDKLKQLKDYAANEVLFLTASEMHSVD